MVLGILPVPGRPTIWITVGQGPTALAVGASGGCLNILLSSILSLLFLPLWEPVRYRLKYCLKGPLNPTQPTNNQIQGRRRLVKSGPAKYPRVPKAREERDRDISLSRARARVYVSVCKWVGDCVRWVSSSESFFRFGKYIGAFYCI